MVGLGRRGLVRRGRGELGSLLRIRGERGTGGVGGGFEELCWVFLRELRVGIGGVGLGGGEGSGGVEGHERRGK